jgi:hypothetical protein
MTAAAAALVGSTAAHSPAEWTLHENFVIPGRRAAANPESIFQRLVSMDSGFASFGRAPE